MPLRRLELRTCEPRGAAAAVGIQKARGAFHLDKLADEGLLSFEIKRLGGHTGPGAGRPSKLYRRSDRQIELSLPPRAYDLAGQLLVEATAESERSKRSVRAELDRVSHACGGQLAADAVAQAGPRSSNSKLRQLLEPILRTHGFEPRVADGDIILANCPFHARSERSTDPIPCAGSSDDEFARRLQRRTHPFGGRHRDRRKAAPPSP